MPIYRLKYGQKHFTRTDSNAAQERLKTVEPGDMVTLTENQAAAFGDKFEYVGRTSNEDSSVGPTAEELSATSLQAQIDAEEATAAAAAKRIAILTEKLSGDLSVDTSSVELSGKTDEPEVDEESEDEDSDDDVGSDEDAGDDKGPGLGI